MKGTEVQRAILMANLKGTAGSTKELNARYNSLVNSKNVHVVQFEPNQKLEPTRNQTDGPYENDSNEKGTGSTTFIKSAQTKTRDGTVLTIGAAIAHEVLGHGYDKDKGTIDRSIDPDSDIPNSEIEATRIENQYREAEGLNLRETYGDKKLPD